jgi:hypothetical protein
MKNRFRLLLGLFICAASCARIVDADGPYRLVDGGSSGSTGGSGGVGGMMSVDGGPSCMTAGDCPSTSVLCLVNACVDGACRIENAAAGTPCASGFSDVCNGQGSCVECLQADDCLDIVEDQCTKRACVNNTCQIKYLGPDSVASPAAQKPGDCKIVVCNGFGGTKTVNDDLDTPDDDNGCTVDGCLNGSEVHTNVAVGTSCGINSECDIMGKCVGSMKTSDCPGTFTFCKDRVCQAGVCGVKYATNGTALPSSEQVPQDCLVMVCDGEGNKVPRVDVSDVPIDGNSCTQDSCNSDGTASNPPENIGTFCAEGDNDICDGFGACRKSNGKPCAAAGECVSGFCVDGVCCDGACDGACQSCNTSLMTAGLCTFVGAGQADPNAAMPCQGTAACDGNGSCKKNDGEACASSNECFHGYCVDGVCCVSACTSTCKACNVSTSLGACVNVPVGVKDDIAQIACNGTKACNGNGYCKLSNGQPCSMDSQCASGKCSSGSNKTCQP